MSNNEQIKKALSFLIKAIPADVIKNNQELVDEAVGDAVDVIADKQYKEPIKLVRTICKYVPIEAIQKNPELVERIVQAAINKDAQQIMEVINEIGCQDGNNNQHANITLSEAQRIEGLLQYFTQNIATSPEQLATYLFKFGIEAFSSICNSINDIKKLDVIDKLAEIEAAKDIIEFGRSNPDWKREKLSKAQDSLFVLYRQLEKRFTFHLSKIKERDSLPDWQFYLFKGPIDLITGEIDTNNQIAQLAINGIIQAVNLQIIISHELNVDINSSVITNFNELSNEINSSNACDLLHAYEKNKQENFWLSLPNRLNQTLENKTLLIECLES